MVTTQNRQSQKRSNQQTVKAVKVEFRDENVTAFAGMALVMRIALRLGLWRSLDKGLEKRRGSFSFPDIIKAAVVGLLTGSRGSVACEPLHDDRALRDLIGLKKAPSESTFWRVIHELGTGVVRGAMDEIQRLWARRTLQAIKRPHLLLYGFLPVFGDGTLLEGSHRREGTKTIRDKGRGLMWSTWFVGPVLAAQRLAAKGEGETKCLRKTLKAVLRDVIEPLNLKSLALFLLDSLHGDGPTCARLEKEDLKYIVGANKLSETDRVLKEQPDCVWRDRGARAAMNWSESAVCQCWIQCAGWENKRLLIGRRWKKDGEFLYDYSGVMTNLTEADVAHLCVKGRDFTDAVWKLYDAKAGMENYFKDILCDLDGHHPPCEKLSGNRGYYALLALAHTLSVGVDRIGGTGEERGRTRRRDGGNLRRAQPVRMRLWRLRRELLSLPGRISTHARQARVILLGLSRRLQARFERYRLRVSRC